LVNGINDLALEKSQLQKQIESLQSRLSALEQENRQLRATADRPPEELVRALHEFLSVYDVASMAMQDVTQDALDRGDRYAHGVRELYNAIVRCFNRLNLEEISTVGETLDTTVMEATEADEESTLPYGTVSRELEKGFYFRFRGRRYPLRVAKVAVSMGTGAQPPVDDADARRQAGQQPSAPPPSG
jgi:molecular chaperone GrpE (heat shock protein)